MRELGPNEIIFILAAVRWTLLLSLVAFLGGALGGALVALARTSEIKGLRLISNGYIKLFQGTPLLMQLFLAFFVPGLFGWSVDPWTAAALGLSLHASAFLGEIWRGAIEVVPRGQWEAATSLGLRYTPKMALIIVPQAIRIAIPPTIGFLVQLIKGTSLASIIGFVELTRAAQVINNATFRPFTIFALVALVYFLICWPLSAYSKRMERKLLVAAR
ncbi:MULTISPECIES: amino acid ABC transporter permease [unclassified Bosea (in: a-proteobacteria)]|jgi:polar amino acid transport system permease protein|uniref:amino acid ABC transporter permease n=1 Tax=Bosea sp. (in: a-proteobacteria) TaxID=1871050 RepID=UPI001AC7D23F|nr:amino acid ABC transporter permease [Bosea sp. (in: a-proteobacteria)]MBN9470481.1 amino acid ABC transporter permease [Bosea sp. (in: a-proteobacteria)]